MQQYIDFYKKNRELIDRGSHPLLNEYREDAATLLETLGFPAYRSEEYQHTDIASLLSPDYGFYLGHAGKELDLKKVFRCHLPNVTSLLQFTVNGHYRKEDKPLSLPEGVFSGSLNAFATQHSDVFHTYYNKLVKEKGDGLTAFNALFVQDGYVLYVPKGVVIEPLIQLTHICGGTIDALVNRRILIILEDGAQAKLLACDHTMEEQVNYAITQVAELFVGANAVLDYYELEETGAKTVRLNTNLVRQEASSNVMINSITLSNGVSRSNHVIDLEGENAETNLLGLAIGDEEERIDNYTVINHKVPHCRSNELFKYVLAGNALGAFSGRIVVFQDAQKTAAYQNNRNLCEGNTCKMYSKPQLEIYADDVKCSHGMTTGQLDENALFYMRSRGIPETEARYLLKLAFTMDVINEIRVEGLKERLRHLSEKRFRGELVKCQGCT